ncbi:MAG: hypothetical protein ABH872_02110 [Candidatus Omnitrophota bacterium]
MIITKKEVDYIKLQPENHDCKINVDFGLKIVSAKRTSREIILNNTLTFSLGEKIKENFCYIIDDDGINPVAFFSDTTNRFYKLTPTPDWPTISIGSVPMHKLKSPRKDTQSKIKFAKPQGIVLDTCMGLGYTAIGASEKARKVITFEADSNVAAIARTNPISKPLFSKNNIEIRHVDVTEGIEKFGKNYFDSIIHDPPTFKLSPDLYSIKFYGQLLRVLKSGKYMFHYTPLYKVKQGYDFPSRVKGNLKKAGFKIISFSQEACGWLCKK